MTSETLEWNHEVVSIPHLPEAKVIVVSPDFNPILVVSPPDGELKGVLVMVTTSTPGTLTGREVPAPRGIVGAEYPFEEGNVLPALRVLAESLEISHKGGPYHQVGTVGQERESNKD